MFYSAQGVPTMQGAPMVAVPMPMMVPMQMVPVPVPVMQGPDMTANSGSSGGPTPSGGGYEQRSSGTLDAPENTGSGGGSPSPMSGGPWPPPPPELAPSIERVSSGAGPAPQFSPQWSAKGAADRQ